MNFPRHPAGKTLIQGLCLCLVMFCAFSGRELRAESPAESALISSNLAVRAIVGEAANQGERGMLAVACAIRNRGTLRGVYGLNASFVDREPPEIWERARRAWAQSATVDITGGATHWENVRAFGAPLWARRMAATVTIRDHQFFRQKKRWASAT
jgi:hypothetical protein